MFHWQSVDCLIWFQLNFFVHDHKRLEFMSVYYDVTYYNKESKYDVILQAYQRANGLVQQTRQVPKKLDRKNENATSYFFRSLDYVETVRMWLEVAFPTSRHSLYFNRIILSQYLKHGQQFMRERSLQSFQRAQTILWHNNVLYSLVLIKIVYHSFWVKILVQNASF